MAKTTSVWGIDVGQAALKALRCRLDGDQVVAEAFDYIEYPKILTQPEAEPESLVREALQTFIDRNSLRKTRVALSVPGQNGLAKFFKPPPVELKKVGDIVKYEARTQIPFDLQDVIWDYQLMAGAHLENNFALESEVGLFAMKRDAVYRTLKPLQEVDIEVDLLQLAPLSIYNAMTYDKQLLQGEELQYDSEHPPKFVVIMAMGTDATDLIVTNGFRVWQRSMPLGGNHFTRQLTKDLKLTFAKAEHLKRNAMEADDPKLIFQAMRPIFNDLVTEIQRSIGFFRTLNKKAEIGSLLLMGNSIKLPGLSQYLSKNLSMEVEVIDRLGRLAGEEVITAPAFRDHLSTFASVYGLCLQGLNSTAVYTNLIPKELVMQRVVQAKKPWVVATAATLLLGMAGSLLPAGKRYDTAHPDRWKSALSSAEQTKTKSDSQTAEDKKLENQAELLLTTGTEVSGSNDRRLLWLEIISAINQALNHSIDADQVNPPDPRKVPFNERDTLYVTKIDCKFFNDISLYKTSVEETYKANSQSRLELLGLNKPVAEGEATDTSSGSAVSSSSATAGGDAEASKSGWVFEIDAYHFHNGKPEYRNTGDEQEGFVLKRLIHRLEEGAVKLPVTGEDGQTKVEEFTFKELGISNPLMVNKGIFKANYQIPNPDYKPPKLGSNDRGGITGMGGVLGGGLGGGLGTPMTGLAPIEVKEDPDNPRFFEVPRHDFKVQFIWQEQPLSKRMAAKKAKAEEEAKKAEEAKQAEAASGENVAANQ